MLSVIYYGSMMENVAYREDFFPNFKVFDENFA